MSVQFQDYYAVLGVARDASAEDIQRAYRKLARQSHPDVDKSEGATQRFQRIQEAYEVLKDPEKRKRYDTLGASWREGQEFTPPPGWEHAHAGRGGATSFDFEDLGGFSSFFEAMFGGAPGGGRSRGARAGGGARPRAGASHEASVAISLEDAFAGATRSMTLEGEHGSRTYDVRIPPGTTHGSTIRLRGQGAAGRHGGPPGDLYLRVEIAPHARFEVDGHDLSATLAVAPWEAALGAKVPFATLDGGEVVVAVPPGTSSGRKLRLRGQGLPRREGARGDLVLGVRIVVPPSATEEQKRLWDELARASRFDPRGGGGAPSTSS